MLSIIISSYQKHYFDQLTKNISETIGDGFQYEIIQIWNPNLMSITKAYNSGAEQAKFENLLFLHEDLIFHTQNWGSLLIDHINQESTGIIGVAGSSYVPHAPSSWTVAEKYNFVNILQGNKKNTDYTTITSANKLRTKVFAIDGVFLAVAKEHYKKILFDEDVSGFHGYDLDFSLRASEKFDNYIINNILVQHFSSGNLDKTWLDANIRIKEKLKATFHKNFDSEVEKNVFLSFLYKYFSYYPVNLKNLLFTFRFYPSGKLSFADKKLIFKKYFNYLSYASSINKKINHSQKD
ncbi:Glycosyltransferase like family protein [Chryseobacterium arachidis]|uniref:Glycosyltransferase like family protein n=1 Tax=Chryseobacterium arachidis TaxID=1416778 RepID=A0A1M4XEX6_9FLAO|nr:glycosyltransferase [Chryseobacterium arachidis]SHE92094.1 Glycosyltransferase like family protein [Chryseobacterium arachidis]